jgi:protein strawberry notch
LAKLYREIQTGKHSGDGLGLSTLERMGVLNKERTAVRDDYSSNVEQFLNRIMVLHVELQNRIFDLFYENYVKAVEAAKRQGAFDFGVEEIRAKNLRRIAEPETLYVDAASGARTVLHEIEGEVDVVRNSFEEASCSAGLGFYRNKRSQRVYAVGEHWNMDQGEVFLTAVKGGRRSLERYELDQKYEPVDAREARLWWDAEYAATPATEPHRFYILSGAIFPIYDKVMGSSGIQSVKIARAVLQDGQALVGLNLSPTDVPNVKQRLGIGTPLALATPEEILELVLGGAVIELDNGWRLTSARIAGDEVVELSLNGVPANRNELEDYGYSEEIVHFKRRWFVIKDDAGAILPRLLAHRKPVKDVTVSGTFAIPA